MWWSIVGNCVENGGKLRWSMVKTVWSMVVKYGGKLGWSIVRNWGEVLWVAG